MTASPHWIQLPWRPDRRPIHEWAADHVILPPVLTKSGHFDWRESRHFLGPLAALQSDIVREVNIRAPVRSGKSLIADLWVPWVIANDPAAILWVFDVDESAKKHCESRLMPVLIRCDALAMLLPDSGNRHKLRNQEIVFANGLPLHVVGPAISNLQARGYRVLVCDEVWNYPAGRLGEAKARMGDFEKVESNKGLFISQGGSDGDQWDEQCASGEMNEWNVCCLSCGHRQPLVWSGKRDDQTRWGILYDAEERKDGTYDLDRAAATARFACRACGHEHPDTSATRSRWNLHGEFVVSGDQIRTRKTFTFPAMVDTPWSQLVVRWLKARHQAHQGFYHPTVQFLQKYLAQNATEAKVIEQQNPVDRVEFNPSEEWPEEAARFLSVDVQKDDLYYVMVCAVSRTGEFRRLHWGSVFGDAAVEAVRVEFKVPPPRTLCDTGHMKRSQDTDERRIYKIVAARGWLGTKGTDLFSFTHDKVENGQAKQVSKPWSKQFWGDPERGEVKSRTSNSLARCIRFSVPVVADRTAGLMERGFWKDPTANAQDEAEIEYQAQLRSEIKVAERDIKTGRWRRYWKQIRKDNHALDCARLQVLGAMMMGIL